MAEHPLVLDSEGARRATARAWVVTLLEGIKDGIMQDFALSRFTTGLLRDSMAMGRVDEKPCGWGGNF